jgi:hypothetical protein
VIAAPRSDQRGGKLDGLGNDCRHPGGNIRRRSRRVAGGCAALLVAGDWFLVAFGEKWGRKPRTTDNQQPDTSNYFTLVNVISMNFIH